MKRKVISGAIARACIRPAVISQDVRCVASRTVWMEVGRFCNGVLDRVIEAVWERGDRCD